jgi:hypothetical protein
VSLLPSVLRSNGRSAVSAWLLHLVPSRVCVPGQGSNFVFTVRAGECSIFSLGGTLPRSQSQHSVSRSRAIS